MQRTTHYGEPISAMAIAAIVGPLLSAGGGLTALGLGGRQKRKEQERMEQMAEVERMHQLQAMRVQAEAQIRSQAYTVRQAAIQNRALVTVAGIGAVVVAAGIGAFILTRGE